MQTIISSKQLEITEALRSYIDTKLGKFDRMLDASMEAHVMLKVEKYRHIAEIRMFGNGLKINGVEESDDMYTSIDKVIDKIERQFRKYKTRIVDRKQKAVRRSIESPTEDLLPNKFGDRLVYRSRGLKFKPMTLDEAVMQFDMSGFEFLVFRNSSSEEINVVFRRRDGNIGLIEP